MKPIALLCVFLLLIVLLPAQEMNPFMNLIHSSRGADGNLRVRWEDLTGDMLNTQCLYNTGTSWQSAATQQHSDSQMQALVPYTFGQSLRYRLRTQMGYEDQTYVIMHTPYLNADSFPPQNANLGLIGTDATGDLIEPGNNNLDFTDTWFAATETKLYSAAANVSNSFPTFNSLTSYNLYATTIANPETAVDTLVYAMIYTFNIAGVISPGLYKVSIDDTGMPYYARLGDIQSQVSAGKLYLACNISDLTSDPDFGVWPNSYNALVIASISMSITVNLATLEPEFGIGDYSTPCAMLFQDYHYQVDQNSLPQISNFAIELGEVPAVSFDYTDADADFPLLVEYQILGGETFLLLPSHQDYSQSVTYAAIITNGTDPATLRISDNGIDFVEYHHNWSANPEDPLPVAPLMCRMPNPLRFGSAPFEFSLSGLNRSPLQLSVFNLRGQKLGTIFSGANYQDQLSLSWDGTLAGKRLESGLYILQINQNNRTLHRKFVISK